MKSGTRQTKKDIVQKYHGGRTICLTFMERMMVILSWSSLIMHVYVHTLLLLSCVAVECGAEEDARGERSRVTAAAEW